MRSPISPAAGLARPEDGGPVAPQPGTGSVPRSSRTAAQRRAAPVARGVAERSSIP